MLAAPATATITISGLINKVKAALQNRSDATETALNPEMRPSAWLRDTLRELTANYPFTELEKPGPLVTIGPGLGFQGSNYMYPVNMFLDPGDDITLTQDPTIFYDGPSAAAVGIVATTSNVVAYPMDNLTGKAIQSLLFIPGGVPSKYARFGSMYWFGPQPGRNYNVYLPYQVRHPIYPDVLSTPVRLPQDWEDILCYAAAERGAIALRWNDQANFLHTILYGDPKTFDPASGEYGRPGLLSAKILQAERDRRLGPVQITPGAERY